MSGSKTVLEASKERDMVLAFVPTSAVGCAGRWHVERQKQLEVEREVLRTRSSSDGSSLGIDTRLLEYLSWFISGDHRSSGNVLDSSRNSSAVIQPCLL